MKKLFIVSVGSNIKRSIALHVSKLLDIAIGAELSTVNYTYRAEAIPFCIGVCAGRSLELRKKKPTKTNKRKSLLNSTSDDF